MEFEEIINNQKEGKIDLRKLKCNPTTLLPLLCECKNHNLKLGNGEKAFEYLVNSLKDNELFSKLPESRVESDEVDFITEYMLNINCEYGGYFALRTVISEIANNVYDHSRQECEDIQSYIFSKLDEHYKKLDITLVDDGASIPKVFELSNVDFDNDCKQLKKQLGCFQQFSMINMNVGMVYGQLFA